IATTVKLIRNSLLGVIVLVIGSVYAVSYRTPAAQVSVATRVAQSVPLFAVGFFMMALANTLGMLDWLSVAAGTDVKGPLEAVVRLLIVMAMGAVGLGTEAASLRRIGVRPLYVALVSAVLMSLLGLTLVRLMSSVGA
ncbi:MAG: putative sulfate exporter family transporter, partial [Longimicrobiales bacterium]